MKQVLIYISVLILVGAGLAGCYKDVLYPEVVADPDGPPMAVSFKTELAPMLNTKCALAGCHVTGAHKPYLKTDESYQQIVNGGFVNTAIPKESILYKMINGEMREYIPSAADRQKVYDWIRNGAPNN
ncbi:MAG TPA: hypothetical protein VFX58_00695 [Chitinophagaceae bacterium]|nr:hypothetical protein [Chitinophagaceae bacterium]